MSSRRHNVTLLAPSGREQAVVLVVAREGVQLQTTEGKDINTFVYETIRKWLPSHLRSKNPGPDDCLDLQIETDKGPRDLRMRCSNSMGVKQLMKDLRDTVESIMHEMDDQQIAEQEREQQAVAQQQSREAPPPMQEMPTLAGPVPSLGAAAAAGAGAGAASTVDSIGHLNAETQTLVDLAPPPQQQRGSDGGAMLVQGPPGAGGVAQLFVAHPTGIALPVGSRGVPTPALMEGLHVAASSPGGGVPLVPASGTFAYEYLDNYGTGPGGAGEELEVADRVSSAAPGFFNAMFMTQRAALPGYGGPPPPQHMSPGGSSSGGALPPQYYAQPYENVAAAPPPPPPVAYYAPPPQAAAAAAYPQMAPRGYTPVTTGGSAGGGGSRGRAPRRSDPANTSPARRRVEFSGVRASPGGGAYSPSGGGSGSEGGGGTGPGVVGPDGDLALQVRFLEDLVSRLSAEVSRRAVSPERATAAALALAGAGGEHPASPTAASLAAQPPPTAAPPPAPAAPPAIDYEALLSADALGAAAVLRDQKLLAPLLGAYDGRIAALEADLRSRTDTVAALKAQVDEVVEENDRLRADTAAAAEARDVAVAQANRNAEALAQANSAAAAAAAAAAGASTHAEEVELLRRENELLITQQGELDSEIQRLHRQLQERAAEVMRVSQEQAALAAAAQQANAKAAEAEARAVKLTEALRAAEAKAAALALQANRNKAAADESSTAAATTKAALDELRHAHAQLQAEAAAAQQRYKIASDGAASLQLELSTQRERGDSLAGQVSALSRECETLRNALGGVEGKLTELQKRDVDVWSRVKEAMSAAEEARLARDTALARCADLERQVQLANTRLTTARQATRDAVVDEFSAQVAAAQAAAAQVREELSSAHSAVTEWRSRAERLERDQASLTAELAALREDTAATLASKSRLGLASLGAVEKVASLERERDDAVAKLESAQRKAERAARDWQLERQSYENTIRGLKSNIAELEANLSTTRAEAATTRRQADALTRELAAARAQRQQAEADLRQQIASLRADRDAEVRALSSRIDAQATASTVAAAEAERLLSSKQEVLARWREEAQTLASRMEAALSDHKRELAAKAHEAAELRARCEALAGENVELAGAVSELEAKLDDLQGQLADAEARAEAAAGQVVGSANREAELQQELRQLQMALDRLHFEKSRMQRTHDPLVAKYDALKKDIRQAAVPGGGAVAQQQYQQQHPQLATSVGAAPPVAQETPGMSAAAVAQTLYGAGPGNGVGVAGGAHMGWPGSPDGVVHAARVPRGAGGR
ncbi:hypothetical protein HYH02_011639 [Chlamydomonas schloesseri]|uniref:Uncharacterized protein n=1 Tax=Chlamydomonas schloesseri TaxID=2026947 RepID=A0A835TDY4_9CHLO|nr:hypothetical protein HYH02_011639 [Chlamydomonas schloesseri]|eukprot:KAG2436130.1 hypothetical protein HYH02_011639 [Chlamydomonas schloesseri]